MAEAEQHESNHDKKSVKVTFPVSPEGPYKAKDAGTTTAGVVRTAAMTHFRVADGPQVTYVLAYDGDEVAATQTLEAVAGQAHEVKFALVKKITQG